MIYILSTVHAEGYIMLRRLLLLTSTPVLAFIAATGAAGDNNDHNRHVNRITAELKSGNEVPALSSTAHGRFKAIVDADNQTISYELSYEGLQAAPLQAHIHIGQRSVNGGISVFLCGNAPNVPAAPAPTPPACPDAPATVTGVLTAADIIGPTAQGIDPTSNTVNEFDELVAMLRRELAYANVHSGRFPGGEIRGQVRFEDKKR
jgi:hypothetical protein